MTETNPLAELASAALPKDHAVLVLVQGDGEGSVIVQRNDMLKCFKALAARVIDEFYDKSNYSHVEAIKSFDRLVGDVMVEWEKENE